MATLVPELKVTDFAQSLEFYTEVLGFAVRYGRPADRFAYLERQGAELMIEQAQAGDRTAVGELRQPFGRGVNFQIMCSSVDVVVAALAAADLPLFLPIESRTYGTGEGVVTQRQVWVQDPDGYLLRFAEIVGDNVG